MLSEYMADRLESSSPYYDSAADHYLDQVEALDVLEQHGLGETDEEYQEWSEAQCWPIQAQILLDWLGY